MWLEVGLWKKCFGSHTKKSALASLSDKPPLREFSEWPAMPFRSLWLKNEKGLKNNSKNGLENMVEDGMKNKMEAGERETTYKVIEIIQTTHDRGQYCGDLESILVLYYVTHSKETN